MEFHGLGVSLDLFVFFYRVSFFSVEKFWGVYFGVKNQFAFFLFF